MIRVQESEFFLKIKHRLSFYHLRRMYKEKTGQTKYLIAVCDCGYKYPFWRKLHGGLKGKVEKAWCGMCGGHQWDEPDAIHVGPVGFEESADTVMSVMVQCDRCYKCKMIWPTP